MSFIFIQKKKCHVFYLTAKNFNNQVFTYVRYRQDINNKAKSIVYGWNVKKKMHTPRISETQMKTTFNLGLPSKSIKSNPQNHIQH